MNSTNRNLIVMFLLAASCLITTAMLVFIELKFGLSLYDYTAWSYVPVGAIGAGTVAAMGYYFSSRMLRLRPSRLMLAAIVALSVGSVFLIDSIEYGLATEGPGAIGDVASVVPFLSYSLSNSPLRIGLTGGGTASTNASSGAANPTVSDEVTRAVPRVSDDSNASVQEIGSGLQGALASNKVQVTNKFDGVRKMANGAQALGSGVLTHSAQLELAAVQMVCFALGGIVAYTRLRSLSYCDGCKLFLRTKGTQTRYFDREREIRSSVDDFLTNVKGRRFRQSMETHSEEGSTAKTSASMFSSTVEVRRCMGCRKHRLKLSAWRKAGGSWKEISALGHTAFCLEPVDVIRGFGTVR
jgi:hypothetical protein